MIGFEELGNQDQFQTVTLEWQLLNCGKDIRVTARYNTNCVRMIGVIQKEAQGQSSMTYGSATHVRHKIRRDEDGGDSDFDLDD